MNMLAQLPEPRPPFAVRVLRALAVTTKEPPKATEDFYAGSDFAAAEASKGTYQPVRAMSALKANPWAYAANSQIEGSLAALPLLVEEVDAEGNWTPAPDHEVARLLERPTSWQTQRQWRKQLVRYLLPVGWVTVLQAGRAGAMPTGLIILHPHRSTPVPGEWGAPRAWEYDKGGQRCNYDKSDVLFFSMPTVGDGPNGAMLGMGFVEPLDRQIETSYRVSESMAKKAKRGRPEAIYHPSDGKTTWAGKVVSEMRKMLKRLFREEDGGVAVLSGAGTLTPLEWKPQDMQAVELQQEARDGVVAVWGVPPTMLGLQSANYATAQMERANFYEATLMPIATDIDDVLTAAARGWGFPNVRVRHDFSGVEALQEGRSERLERVKMWRELGAAPAEAAVAEGFDEAPELPTFGVDDNAPLPKQDDQAQAEEDSAPRMSEDTLAQAAALRELVAGSNDDDSDDDVDDEDLRVEVQVLLDSIARDEADAEPDEEDEQ